MTPTTPEPTRAQWAATIRATATVQAPPPLCALCGNLARYHETLTLLPKPRWGQAPVKERHLCMECARLRYNF